MSTTARCNCSGSVCSCVIVDGIGTEVEGAGSSDFPYKINATGNIEGVFQVIDTPTLDLHLNGEGNPDEPFQLSGDVTMTMSQLSDVLDPTGFALEGEVPVWTNGHWEFKTPAAAPPGAVNVGAGLTGDGSAGTPLKASISGVWGAGTMAPSWPADSTLGHPIYVDANGQLRARPVPIRHRSWSGTGPNNIVPATGFSTSASQWWQWGPINSLDFVIKRTGANINSSSDGNVSNFKIADLASDLPKPAGTVTLRVTTAGREIAGWIGPSGTLNIGTMAQNIPMATNDVFDLQAMWISTTGWPVSLPDGQLV